ncbi:MAG: hypothetical protein ACK4WC_04690 [Rubrimonas sp.]|jgi:hypothetical protein
MARDTSQPPSLDELSDAEIERIEAALFVYGGPPERLTPALAMRAQGATATRAVPPAA